MNYFTIKSDFPTSQLSIFNMSLAENSQTFHGIHNISKKFYFAFEISCKFHKIL